MADETHWVYVISRVGPNGLTGPVKIGISKDTSARLSTIQTACPFQIDLAYIFECPNRAVARDVEKAFHDTQRDKHTHGEWFDFEPVHAIHLLCIAFRALLAHHVSDPSVIDASLDLVGVYWAEKRFNLAVPNGVTVQ